MAQERCRWISGVLGALTSVFFWTNAAPGQPTLQFELVKYDYPAAPSYAEGEPEYYQNILAEKGGPVVPGWLVANWLWDMVPTGKQQIPQARLKFRVNDLIGPDLGFVKIKGSAIDEGNGYIAFHFDQSGVAFRKKGFCANRGTPTDFNIQIGGATVLWLGYFPDGMSDIGMYLIVRVKGERMPNPAPYSSGKGVVGYSKD
jgi:hypothetical protein